MLEKSWFSQTFPLAQETNKTEKLKLPILYRVTCSRKKVVGKQESRGWGIAAGAGLALCSPCRLSQDAGCPGLVPPRQHVLAMCSLQHQPWPASRCQLEQSILKNNYSNLIVLFLGNKSVLKKAKACCAQTQIFSIQKIHKCP